MLITYTTGFATVPPIAFYLFVFRVVSFIIDDLKKKSLHLAFTGTGVYSLYDIEVAIYI